MLFEKLLKQRIMLHVLFVEAFRDGIACFAKGDHYRGDVERTTRNLSGGESFEVSLALALGLSEMSLVSQKASLGNVLLDEGFGTLDDKSLDSALDLLMQLRTNSGKLVGIISHVEKLRDKIETRIQVTNSCGVGMLSGPGVRQPAQKPPK